LPSETVVVAVVVGFTEEVLAHHLWVPLAVAVFREVVAQVDLEVLEEEVLVAEARVVVGNAQSLKNKH
jgi:hypothetical protein